jgi:hypothetical protein
MLGNSRVTKQLVDSQEELKSIETVDDAARISGYITSSDSFI